LAGFFNFERIKMAKITSFEEVEDAISTLAVGHLTLEAAVKANLALDELVLAQDQQIKLLIALIDGHHRLFVEHGWAPARPKVDPLAN
jgi:hypothetical protein